MQSLGGALILPILSILLGVVFIVAGVVLCIRKRQQGPAPGPAELVSGPQPTVIGGA